MSMKHFAAGCLAMPDGDIEVEVTSPVFYDPAGARINA